MGEPRKTHKGKTVINFSVVVSKDKFNQETNTWENDAGGKYYESVTAFGRLADNIIKSFKPGDRVIVQGERVPKPDYTDSKGVEHQNENQVNANAVGPDLEMWPWKAVRENDGSGSNSGSSSYQSSAASKPAAAPAAAPAATVSSSNDDDDDDW
jgi:single-stranded DNA-binding protein